MATVQDLIAQAPFAFEGRIEQVGASTVSDFPASSETAVVSINHILKSPPALAGYEGHRVTIQLQAPVSLKAGQSAVFFTEAIYFGDGLVVREIGNVAGGEPTMQAHIASAAQAGEDSELKQRLGQAALVISGVASEPVRFV